MATTQPSLPGRYLEPQMGQRPDSDSDSDSDSPVSSSARTTTSLPAGAQVIHSGHFMVSSPHSDLMPRRRHHWAKPEPPRLPSIDPTLTRLFECMSLAYYSGKLVSPKWKNFKGLRMLCRDKIRLNNAIWRAWYIQYVERRKSSVCGFVTPLDGSEADEHRKPEAVVLEGKYWKRRIEVVMKEYHKWRIYHKKRLRRFSREGEAPSPKPEDSAWRSSGNWCEQLFSNVVPMLLRDQEEAAVGRQLFDLDSFLSDISDTLFTMTQGSCAPQPVPEEAYIGNADMIQPDLAPLQPNLDDFMEISDFFTTPWTLPTSTSLSYQEQPCFMPAPETLYGGGNGSSNPSPGPASPPIQPSAHLQAKGGCSTQLGPRGAFLGSDHPPALPPSSSASSLSPHPRQKPPPPYTLPGRWLSLDSYGPCCPAPLPGLPLLNQDPHSKLHYPPSPAMLATAPFPQSVSVPGYGGDLPSGYAPPYSTPHLHAGMPGPPTFGTTRGQLQSGGSSNRPKARVATSKAQRAGGLPTPPPLAATPDCLTQLLTTAKPEPNLEARTAPSHTLVSTLPGPRENAFCEEPARLSLFSPRMTPLSSPSQPITPPEGPLLVPKSERVSPTLICASSRRASGQGSPVSTEGPGIRISSPPRYSSSQSRLESSKVETRRITHISAEQKRRFNIKLGFDTLHSLVSTLSAQPSLKVSKATTLQKTAEYICKLQQERVALQDEAQRLRDQIEELNATINLCQQQLPATGVPITRQRFDQMREMFDEYVRACTLQNWKFWVFSILIRPLFESFNGMVSTASLESLRQTSLAWLDEYCSLPALRPTVLSSLRQLSVSTSILTNPAGIPDQATQAVTGADPKDSPS